MAIRLLGLFLLLAFPSVASAEGPVPARLDAHGFPLPDGAVARLGDLRFAQRGRIDGIAVSPDGTVVATAGAPYRRVIRDWGEFEESVLSLWNAETGRITREIPLGVDGRPIAFTPDGKLLAISKPGFEFVDVATGQLFWPNDRPERPAFVKPHFLDNGRLMAGHNSESVEVWDVAKGTLVQSWKRSMTEGPPHREHVEALKLEGYQIRVSLSPSGATMAWFVRTPTGRLDWPSRSEVHVFDTVAGERKGGIVNLHGYYAGAALLDEGETVLLETTFLSNDPGGVRDIGGNVAFDVGTARERFRIHHIVGRDEPAFLMRNPIEGIRLLSVAPDGKSFYTFGTRSFHERRDTATGKVLARLEGFSRGTELMFGFAADGKRTVVANSGRWYWGDLDLQPLAEKTEWPNPFPAVRYLSGGRIRVPGDDGSFRVWDILENKVVESGNYPPTPKLHPEPASLDWRFPKGRDDSHRLLVANHQQRLVVFDRAEGRIISRLEGVFANGPDGRNWPVVTADGAFTLVPQLVGSDLVVSTFETRSGRRLASHRVPAAQVFPGRFPLIPYGQHARPVVSWYSTDGSVYGYDTRDGRLTLVDARTGKALRTLGFAGPPASAPVVTQRVTEGDPTRAPLRLDPDPVPPDPPWLYYTTPGRAFIAASRREHVPGAGYEYALIDRESGAVLRRIVLPAGGQFSHDGRFVFGRRNVDDLVVYETATATLRGTLATGAGTHFSLAIAPDDTTFATGCADSSVLVWDLNRPLGNGPERPPADAPGARVAAYLELLDEVDREKAEPALWALVRGPRQTLAQFRDSLQPAKTPEPGLFDDPHSPPPCLRELRALEVLERIGTADAKQIVETLAGGHADALLTREAKMTLARWP